MPFWSRRSAATRTQQWSAFAADLELEDGSELAGKLREHLDLGSDALGPIYTLARPGQPRLILFDQMRERSGPTGSVSSLRTCVLLRSRPPVTFVSMRVTCRLGRALEVIEAGRTGSARLDFGTSQANSEGAEVDPETVRFDSSISVYTRDEAGARRLLVRATQRMLLRLLATGDSEAGGGDEAIPETAARAAVPPVVVIGAQDVLLTLDDAEPVEFARLAELTADMMGLYAALLAANER